MKGEIRASMAAIAAAAMLVACASKAPATSTEIASTATGAQDDTAAEYKRLIDNVGKDLVCKRQAVTGSRIDSQVCMTRAEMAEQQENADRVMREMRDSAASRQQMPERPQPPPTSPSNP